MINVIKGNNHLTALVKTRTHTA